MTELQVQGRGIQQPGHGGEEHRSHDQARDEAADAEQGTGKERDGAAQLAQDEQAKDDQARRDRAGRQPVPAASARPDQPAEHPQETGGQQQGGDRVEPHRAVTRPVREHPRAERVKHGADHDVDQEDRPPVQAEGIQPQQESRQHGTADRADRHQRPEQPEGPAELLAGEHAHQQAEPLRDEQGAEHALDAAGGDDHRWRDCMRRTSARRRRTRRGRAGTAAACRTCRRGGRRARASSPARARKRSRATERATAARGGRGRSTVPRGW